MKKPSTRSRDRVPLRGANKADSESQYRRPLAELHDGLLSIIAKAVATGDIKEADAPKVAAGLFKKALPQTSDIMLRSLKRNAPQMLRERRADTAGFEKRNFSRWRRAFDLLEMIWVISEEVGSSFNASFRPDAVKNQDYRFEALTFLHARSLLVAREIICLLEGGFPDGALSRWRTLHELAVIGSLIQKHGNEIAYRYLASRFFNSYNAACQLAKYSKRARLTPFTPEEVSEMKRICDRLEARLGKDMRNEYGWAAPALKNPRPHFRMIEESVGLDHWRPRYKWASQHTHGPHRPTHALLGMAESREQVLLVGQSNSGFTDPIQMTAITLTLTTTNLLAINPTFDYAVVMSILKGLSDEIGPLALKLERTTFKNAMKGSRRQKTARRRPKPKSPGA